MEPTTVKLQDYTEAAIEIVKQVFGSMLATEARFVQSDQVPKPSYPVVGAVYFAGSWKGAVLLECSPEQASAFTSRLISIEEPVSVNDDVRDAIGEIANMLAGNLKSLLPAGTALSMPSVVEGSHFTLRVVGGNASVRIGFDSELGLFSLTLVEMLDG